MARSGELALPTIDPYGTRIVHGDVERWEAGGGSGSYGVVEESVKPTHLARAWTGECRLGYGVIFGIKCEHDSVSNCRRNVVRGVDGTTSSVADDDLPRGLGNR